MSREARELEIIRAWKPLVVSVGARRPLKNNLGFIYEEWCPDNTMDAQYLRQRRPMLKEILKQSIDGNLHDDGFLQLITKLKEFKRLWTLVHGDVDRISEEFLNVWSEERVKGITEEMWDEVSEDSKRYLIASLMKYRSFEDSVIDLDSRFIEWLEEYRRGLSRLEGLAKQNPDLVQESHRERIALGKERIKMNEKIRTRVPKLKEEHEINMRQEIFNTVFNHHDLKAEPLWATKIDTISVDANVKLISKPMELGIDSPETKEDELLKMLDEIMSGPVDEIIDKLDELRKEDYEWS